MIFQLDQFKRIQAPGQPIDWIASVYLAIQVAVVAICWFWGRIKVKDIVWGKLKPGRPYNFVLKNIWLQKVVNIALWLGISGAAWLMANGGTFIKGYLETITTTQ